ncbi:MAG: hypothetical protein P8103_04965 [Candidatus Thiodiazotropha sp.]
MFFTPVFGSILLLRDWQAIGDNDQVKLGWIWLAVSLCVVIVTMFVGKYGLVYLIVWYFAWQKRQTEYITEKWRKDIPRKGWILPLLSGALTVAVFVVMGVTVRSL